ncbi:cardiolipin synthase [Paraburkholderia tropica]|uniref:Cardiolipin synthase A n=1 Tax=Paraburkholderia tropica TaxID=92647 RepID=A0AAQ1GHP5_9BURK|nr:MULTISPECIES: cardiolipin synthase [Paraburkholderia]QNB11238.1 cardiolipin synthase [Paraburkholderia tropica]RQM47998.1 cardiolipin synthase [Paraburkholderia bannensis]RQN38729.1 cardiolipin synthase [Paraburkholderia tropica]SEJ90829.1 cardiolipin synthetase 2 [Paraburkholderia tropica]
MHFDWSTLGTLLAVVHVFGLIAACHAILNTRTSQGAIAWAVSLATMPYLTLIPYLFLGRSKFEGYADARRIRDETLRTRAHAPERDRPATTSIGPTDLLSERVIRTFAQLGGMPLVPGNAVRTLVNGEATFAAIFDAIEQARQYVIVQFFIVHADALGEMLKDVLLAAAQRGVRVYFLYDSIGSFDLPASYVRDLRAGGIEVHPFSAKRRFVNRFQLNFRNHRKIVVVDGERAYVGGHNVGVEYLGANARLSPWRDTHIEVRGPVVASIQFAFTEDWYWVTQELPGSEPPAVTPRDGDDMQCLVMPTGPADRQETCSLFFVEAINAASKRIWITTPYLVPDSAVLSALRLAALRGVDVRIMIPSRRDHYVVFEASTLYAYDAVRAGIRIFRYKPGFLHQKVVLIDDVAAAIGSANLDNRSFRLNFEIMVLTVHRGFAAEVEAMLERDFAHTFEIDRGEYRNAPAWRKITMHLARLFAPIL